MPSYRPSPFAEVPANILVRAASTRVADLAGFVIARSGGASPVLLELIDRAAGPGSWPWSSWVDPRQHFRILAPGAVPAAGVVPWAIVRASAPDRVLSSLTDFLTAPEAAGR